MSTSSSASVCPAPAGYKGSRARAKETQSDDFSTLVLAPVTPATDFPEQADNVIYKAPAASGPGRTYIKARTSP